MVALAQNPVVLRPREYLSDNQIALLRQLDLQGPAAKARGGWMLGGQFRKSATFKSIAIHNLTEETFRWGKHRLQLTFTGRSVVEALAPAAKPQR